MHIKRLNFLWFTTAALSLFILAGSVAKAQENTGLQYAIAGDLVGAFGAKKSAQASPTRDRFFGREVELMFFGPIDHNFEAMASAAAHFEAGQTLFELHELYLGSSKLIPRSRFRLGKFFLGIGRLNRFHRHDWPFISAPKTQSDLLNSDEGAEDTGAEYSYLLPLPFYLDLTVGLTSGFNFGHAHTAGSRPLTPTHYTRLATFQEIGETGGLELGASYLGRTGSEGTEMKLIGTDLTAKWRSGRVVRFLMQSEAWWKQTRTRLGVVEKKIGSYWFPQYGFDQNWSFGVRFDTFSFLNKTNALTRQREKNVHYWLVPTLTYRSSEFANFKLSYTNKVYRELSETLGTDHLIEFQATFILGAHPAHDF